MKPRLTDRQALAVLAAYFGVRQVTARAALALLPTLTVSAPWAIPLLRNTGAMVVVAATGAHGSPALVAAMAVSSMAISMLAGTMLYWTGSRFGPQLAERGAQPGSAWASVWNPKRVERAHRWLERWGILAVAGGRLVAPLMAPVALVSGSSKMGRRRFAVAWAAGSAAWIAAVLWLGQKAARAWPWIPDRIRSLSGWSLRIGIASLVLLVVFVAVSRRQARE